MSREWQPGDVAMIKAHIGPQETLAMFGHDDRWHGTDGIYGHAGPIRPLVVIDPEDPQHVQRFHDAYRAARERGGDWRDWTHAALREFTNPTPAKPDEPGKGGIVVAGDGREWFRYTTSEINGADWVRPDARGGTKYARWEDLTDVRVLSEGVTSC